MVFVHGLGGDARDTWTNRTGECWIEWLATEQPEVGLWSFGYDAAPSKWLGSPMDLPDRATNALATLKAKGVGAKAIGFVAHSMGGLLVKEMLRQAETFAHAYRDIASNSQLVVFLSTPHTGSDIPKYLATLDRALRLPLLPRWMQLLRFLVRPTKSVGELERDNANLRQLTLWYRENAPRLGVETVSLYEAKKTYGLLVVPPSSADPGIAGSIPIPEDANHFEIAKPKNRDSLVFTTTHDKLLESLQPKPHPLLRRVGPSRPPPASTNPGTLLNAHYEVVPFIDAIRAAELAELKSWCDGPTMTSVRLFTGPGGSGKTRLFMEWLRRLGPEWAGDFLPDRATEADERAILASARATFVVVDYAEARPALARFLDLAAERPNNGCGRLRVALLARDEADWWSALGRVSSGIERVVGESKPCRLASVDVEGPLRQEVFSRAAEAFATKLDKRGCRLTEPDLSGPLFGRVLYLEMAALAAIEGLPMQSDGLLDKIVDHERRYWGHRYQETRLTDASLAADFDERAARMMAAVTLRDGVATLEDVEALNQDVSGPAEPVFLRLLHELYPGEANLAHLRGLEPDLLGERLIAQVLCTSATRADFLERVLGRMDSATLRHGFTVLGRLGAHVEDARVEGWICRLVKADVPARAMAAFEAALAVGRETPHAPLGRALFEALQDGGTVDLAVEIEAHLPHSTVSLRGVAVWSTEQALRALPAGASEESILSERARLLSRLGNRLSALGRREDALAPAQEAVKLSRELAKRNPDTFTPNLAGSLNNLGNTLREVGRREDALAAAQEAVNLHRELAKRNPDTFTPDLATSLNNLGNTLRALGGREDALAAAQEAVNLRRELAKRNPDAFTPNLAGSLANLGVMLRDVGRREGALAAAQEAVGLYRELARGDADAFTPDLAGSLANLGATLRAVCRREDALAPSQEAVNLYRELARRNPDAFTPGLAISLHNLGTMLSEVGRHDDGLAATKEAVNLRRELARRNPDAFIPVLAMSLNNLGNRLREVGRREDALAATLEAVNLRRELARRNPDGFTPDLATSLNNLGAMLSEVGRREDALAPTQEAVKLYRELAKRNPNAFTQDLATSLDNLGNRLSEVGRREDALAAAREAESLRHELTNGKAI